MARQSDCGEPDTGYCACVDAEDRASDRDIMEYYAEIRAEGRMYDSEPSASASAAQFVSRLSTHRRTAFTTSEGAGSMAVEWAKGT